MIIYNEGNNSEKLIYTLSGVSAIVGMSGFVLPTVPLLPIALGGVTIVSLYGCYHILNKEERELKKKKEEFKEFWNGLGIKNKQDEFPQLINMWETESGCVYSFINPIGLSTKDYENRDVAIKEYLNCNKILFSSNGSFINIQTIEIDLPTVVPFILPKKKSDDLTIELGVNEEGKKVEINFNKIHSWLIAGATGGGKSVCVHNILTQLYCNYSNCTEFYICDMKKTELNNYRNLKSTIKYTDNVDEVEEIIDELLKLADDRHELFIKHNVKNLQQYNRKVNKKDRLSNVVLCIEECVRLMNNKGLQNKIAELCFIARSAGVIVLMTIQRATRNLFSPDIKASLLGKIGFKTTNKMNSQIIMDDDRLFKIRERGECCISCEDISIGETNVKVMYLQEDRIDRILKDYCEYK